MNIAAKRARKSLLVFAILAQAMITFAQPSGWTVDPTAFSSSFLMDAEVLSGGIAVQTGWLGAFVGEECRGVDVVAFFPPGNNYICTFLIHHNAGTPEVTFKYSPDGTTIYDITETTIFVANVRQGTGYVPIPLNAIIPNTAPVVGDIPDQTVAEGASFSIISLDDYVDDTETADADISWSYSGNTALTVAINSSNLATVSIPAEWNGSEVITFTAADDDALPLNDSDAASFTVTPVNDAPVVTDIPDQSVAEGTGFSTINLDDYVSDDDTDDADITWSYSGNTSLTVVINASNVATVTAPADWNGSELLTFTAEDDDATPLSDSDQATFEVTPVNDVPEITGQGTLTTNEDTGLPLSVGDFAITDVDNPAGPFTLTVNSGTNYTVSGTTVTPVLNYHGPLTVPVTVSDGSASSEIFNASVTVNPVNDAPVLTDIPNQTVAEGADFSTILLNNYVSDDETGDANISWTYSGNTSLTVAINTSNVATISIPDEWNGTEVITFTAEDDDASPLSDSDQATFQVTAENDAPVITGQNPLSTDEDTDLTLTDGDFIITDVDNPAGPFTLTVYGGINYSLSGTTITPALNFHGTLTVPVTVSDGISSSTTFNASVTIDPVNDAPAFTSTAIITASEDALYEYTSSAEDIEGDGLTYSASTLPTWLTFNAGTRLLSGTPLQAQVGTHDVTLRVSDGDLTGDQSFTITVSNVNDAPVFTSVPILSATEELAYSYTVTALDADGDGLTFSAPILPSWMAFNTGTHVLSGTPGNAQVGDHNVTLRINDGTVSSNQSFTITVTNVNDVPTFTSTPITSAQEGVAYSYTATATDIDAEDVLSFSSPTHPAWLTFNAGTNTLSGTPENDDVDNHNVTIRVSDGTATIDQNFVIAVSNSNDAPTFTSVPLTSAVEDALYTYNLTAEDIDGDGITFSAVTIPGWLSLSGSTLSGTPLNEHVGPNNVTLRVSDGSLHSDQVFVIAVTNTNDPPSFTSAALTSAIEDVLYTYTATATDMDGDGLTFAAPVIPGWLTFNASTHVLSGTPLNTHVGNHNVTLQISDGSESVNQAFVISVSNVNDAPVFSSVPLTTATEETGYSYTASATDIDNGDILTYSAPVRPGWLTFNTGTHLLSGTPSNDDVGTHNVTLRVNDGITSVNQVFVITVANVNDAPTFTSSPITAATQGQAYNYTVSANDIDNGDILTYSAPVRPVWLTFNAGTRLLSGTPSNDDVGTHNVTLRITDGTVSRDQSFVITVSNVNDAPTFTSTPITSALEDVQYSYTASAEDIDGDGLTFSAPTLPGWLTFNATTHVLSGTPGNSDLGTFNVTLRINDGTVSVNQVFTITVDNENDVPTFTSLPVTTGRHGILYEYTATGDDIDGDALSFSAPVLPGWLTFNGTTHVLSGIPGSSNVGNNNVTLRVSDGFEFTNQSFTIVVSANDAPVFTSTPLTTATEEIQYSYTASASDGEGDPISFSAPVLPGWLTFNSGTRVLRGTPSNDDVGTHNVTLRVSDGIETTNQSFVITVSNVNDAPTFTSVGITSATEDIGYTYTVTAEDMDGDALTFSAPVRPGWLSFNASTHVLSGTPHNEDVGTHNINLRIYDGTVYVYQAFAITVTNVNDAPVFTSTPVTSTVQGALYTYTAVANDVDGDVLSYVASTLPGWLSFNSSTHVLSGTPDNDHVGNHNVTLRVSDGTLSVNQAFVIRVTNENDAPEFTSTPLTTATEDAAYSYTAAATDVDGDALTFSAPVLPGWLSFNPSTRVLSGTPDNDDRGNHSVTLRVSDGIVSVDQAFVINVSNVNDAPEFTSVPPISVLEGTNYHYIATATDIDGDGLTFSVAVKPGWLTFNSSTHELTGIPGDSDVGSNPVTLQVSDGVETIDQSFTIEVVRSNVAPVFTSDPKVAILEGSYYSYEAIAEDEDGDPLTYSALVHPDWLTFDASTHVLSGLPDDADIGAHNVTLQVTDGIEVVKQYFIIAVDNANDAPEFTSSPVLTALEDAEYSYTAAADDIDGDDLTFSYLEPLPAWLSFDPGSHILSGTPLDSDVGTHNVTLRVSDGSLSADQVFVITVSNENDAPVFTSVPVTNGKVDQLYEYIVSAEDSDGQELSFSAPVLPGWLDFDAVTQKISGTPGEDDTGPHNIKITVSDGITSTDQDFTISVSEVGVGNELYLNRMSIYPNPTRGRFIIELDRSLEQISTMEIIDAAGKLLLQESMPAHMQLKKEYNLSGLPAGMYFIRIYNSSALIKGKVLVH